MMAQMKLIITNDGRALLIFDSVSQEMHLVNIGTSNMCGNATSTNDKSKDLEKDNCIIAQISKS